MKSFSEFRAELERECMVAMNERGVRIRGCAFESKDPGCRCPLGTRTDSPFPGPLRASMFWGITFNAAHWFTLGFDGAPSIPIRSYADFYNLGRAYRRKFVEGVGR